MGAPTRTDRHHISEPPPIAHWIYDEKYSPQVIEHVAEGVEEKLRVTELREQMDKIIPYVEAQMAAEETRRSIGKAVITRVLSVLSLLGLGWAGKFMLGAWKQHN